MKLIFMAMHTAVFQSKLIYALESNIYMQMCSREGEATQNKHPLHNMDRWQNGKCTISQFGSGLVGSRFDSDAIHGRFFENGYFAVHMFRDKSHGFSILSVYMR